MRLEVRERPCGLLLSRAWLGCFTTSCHYFVLTTTIVKWSEEYNGKEEQASIGQASSKVMYHRRDPALCFVVISKQDHKDSITNTSVHFYYGFSQIYHIFDDLIPSRYLGYISKP